ncbi:MAG: cobalamin-dependent protein [Candidatus Adiutrix sp.]|jgi:methanogenic corrinoid protein MtbC1|nr:cobalamin-dependent protein [Candidatus Adiutrix sp.]
MTTTATLEELGLALVELDDARAEDLTRRLLALKTEPVDILTACEQALASIGEKYAVGEYYIAGLIMAGEIMSRLAALVTPHLAPEAPEAQGRGRVLIGTIEGDIHDLGKNIAGALLSAHGFEVLDLGVDVSVADFVRECRKFKPDIVGLSALLTMCYPALQKTVAGLKTFRRDRDRPVIFISGAQITDELRKKYGADYYARSAVDTVQLCRKILCR